MSVLSVQSHVVHGYVGNKSAVFPLQLLGLEVDAINSVQFSNHTGYAGGFTGSRLDGDALRLLLEGLVKNGLHAGYTHLLTGYIGDTSFLKAVLEMLSTLRAANPDLVYVCDPVLGDDGKLYVPEELVAVYRESVLPLATIITPNQFECELLSEMKVQNEAEALRACEALHAKGPRIVVLTSCTFEDAEGWLVILASEVLAGADAGSADAKFARYRLRVPKLETGIHYTGTGDLVAALFLAWHHKLGDTKAALERAIGSVQAVLRNTAEAGSSELRLIASRPDIDAPPVVHAAEEIARL